MMTKEQFVWAAHDVLLAWAYYWKDVLPFEPYRFTVWWETYTIDKCMEEYNKLTWEDWYETLYETLKRKNSDYSPWEDAFSNFYMCQEFWVTVQDWIKVRMCDKVSRIKALQHKEPDVVWESLADTWLDLAWYMTIAYIYLHQKYWEWQNEQGEN